MSREQDLPTGGPLASAAERNKGPIGAVLERVLPTRGEVLEIASGAGVHVRHFAQAMPELVWQPTEADRDLLAGLAAELAAHGLANIRPPMALDVRTRPWPAARADALVCINVTHVAPWAATESLFDGAAEVLPAGAAAVLYGPFRRNGRHTAATNAAFDEALRARDPAWGLRDIEAVAETATERGFALVEVIDMPANNFCLVFRRGALHPR